MFGGEFDGWCYGTCVGGQPALVWGFSCLPCTSEGGSTVTWPNPHVIIHDGRNGPTVPDESKWVSFLCQLNGKASYSVTGAAGASIGSFAGFGGEEWREQIDPDQFPNELVFHRNDNELDYFIATTPSAGIQLNASRATYPFMPLSVWNVYENGDAKYVATNYLIYTGGQVGSTQQNIELRIAHLRTDTKQRVSTVGYNPTYGSDEVTLNGQPFIIPNVAQIDQGGIRTNEVEARLNVSVGLESIVHTSYYTIGDGSTWGVHRVGLGGSVPEASCKPRSPTGGNMVVRGAFHQYRDTSLANPEPWVIAYNKDTNVWTEGVWTSLVQPEIGNNPSNPSAEPYLQAGEVENVLSNDEMAPDAINLCYQHIRGRTLALWYEGSSTIHPIPPELEESAPSNATGVVYRLIRCYDSKRANPLFVMEGIIYFVFGTAEQYPTDSCGYLSDGDLVPSSEIGANTDFGRFGKTILEGGGYGIPTFITCDRNDDVYIGGPNFVEKQGPLAQNTENTPVWRHVAKDYYPYLTGPVCDGINVSVALPWSGLISGASNTTRYDFGFIDYRNFMILPTGSGDNVALQIRGFEGTLDFASKRQSLEDAPDDPDYEGWYSTDNPYTTLEGTLGYSRAYWNWTRDWVISGDGSKRVPFTEPTRSEPRYFVNDSQRNSVQGVPTRAQYDSNPTAYPLPPRYWDFADVIAGDPLTITPPRAELYYESNAYSNRSGWAIGPRNYGDKPLLDLVSFGPDYRTGGLAELGTLWGHGNRNSVPVPSYEGLHLNNRTTSGGRVGLPDKEPASEFDKLNSVYGENYNGFWLRQGRDLGPTIPFEDDLSRYYSQGDIWLYDNGLLVGFQNLGTGINSFWTSWFDAVDLGDDQERIAEY